MKENMRNILVHKKQGAHSKWPQNELQILRLAVLYYGMGQLDRIVQHGCLPGRPRKQLISRLQVVLGKQSLAEYCGLHIDIFEVGAANRRLAGNNVFRKGGLLINTEGRLSAAERNKKREKNRQLLEVPSHVWRNITLPRPRDYRLLIQTMEIKRTMDRKIAELKKLLAEYRERRHSI